MLIEDYTDDTDVQEALLRGAAIIQADKYRLLAETQELVEDGDLLYNWWTLDEAPFLGPCACTISNAHTEDVGVDLTVDKPLIFGGYILGIEDGLDLRKLDITHKPDCFLTETLAASLMTMLVSDAMLCESLLMTISAWHSLARERITETPQGYNNTIELTPYGL